MLASRSAATTQEKFALLNCRRLPGRLNTSEAALLLGFQEHDNALLIAAKVAGATGKAGAKCSEVFRSSGSCGAGIESRMAFERHQSNREALPSEESA